MPDKPYSNNDGNFVEWLQIWMLVGTLGKHCAGDSGDVCSLEHGISLFQTHGILIDHVHGVTAAMITNKYILALDQGTTSSRAIIVERSGRIAGCCARGISANSARTGSGRARSRGHLDLATCRRPPGNRRRRDFGRRYRRHRPDQSTRNHHPLGSRNRPAGGQRHCLAKPRKRGRVRSAEGRRTGAALPRQDRTVARCLLFRQQNQAPFRYPRRTARSGRARRNPFRHRRYLAPMAIDRRQTSCHRLQQRQRAH